MTEPTWNVALNDEEKALVAALVQSPAFALLRKVVNSQIATETQLMLQSKDKDEMVRLQGRILGMSMIESLPLLKAHEHERKVKAEKLAANLEKGRERRRHPMNIGTRAGGQ